jgi:anionic cell wall polymer biosynthesis LytR-Cps2A-Psr (LCP) family protein
MSRQRCVLGAILHQADPVKVLQNFTALAEATRSLVTTDIPRGQLPDLIDMALQAKELTVTSLQLVPPLIEPANPDFDVIAEQLDIAIEASVDNESEDAGTTATLAPSAHAAGPSGGGGADANRPVAEGTDQVEAADPPAVGLSSVCSYE